MLTMKKGMTGSGYILVGLILGLLIVVPIIIYATNAFSGDNQDVDNDITETLQDLSNSNAIQRTITVTEYEFVVFFNKNSEFFGQAVLKVNLPSESNLMAIDFYKDQFSVAGKPKEEVWLLSNPCHGENHCFCRMKIREFSTPLAELPVYYWENFSEISEDANINSEFEFTDKPLKSRLVQVDYLDTCTVISDQPSNRYKITEGVTFGGVILAPDYESRLNERLTEANKFGVNYVFKTVSSDAGEVFVACKLEGQC